MSKVEGGIRLTPPPPPLKASCNYFFLYAFRVNRAGEFQNLDLIIFTPMGDFLQMPSENH